MPKFPVNPDHLFVLCQYITPFYNHILGLYLRTIAPTTWSEALLLMGMRHSDRAWFGRSAAIAIFASAIAVATATGQFASTNQFTLTDAQVDAVDSGVEGELAAIEALVADEHWDEAVGRLQALAEVGDDRVVLANAESGLYVGLGDWCHRLICRLPPPALALYRARVDGLSRAWYDEAIATRDEALLEQVARQVFASSYGDDALLALGELALERADYAAARRAWEQITPLSRDPNGRPMWIALAGIDLQAQWTEIEPMLADRGESVQCLVYPDSDIDAAQVLARLALVSIREGAFDRAVTELHLLECRYPEAIGTMGGKETVLVDQLRKLLTEARACPEPSPDPDWLTFGGTTDRNGIAGRVPESLGQVAWRISIEDEDGRRDGRVVSRAGRQHLQSENDLEERLSVHPIVAGDRLLYCDRNRIYALYLARGESAVAGRSDGVLYAPEREPSQADFQPGRGRLGVPRHTLTADNRAVFARTGSPLTSHAENSRRADDEGLVGLEIEGGRLHLMIRPPSDRWAFEGTPLVDGNKVLIAMRQQDVRPRAVIACFDRTSGHLLWQKFVASGETPARPGWEEVSHNLLTVAGETVYYNTNLGVIAALGTRDGKIHWIKRYDRAGEGDLAQLPAHFDRDLTPCVYHHGVIYCAPADTPYIFALDAVTGETIWSSNVADEVVHLLGVSENRLIASGSRVWWFDAVTGDIVGRWPEGPGAGLHGYGRGLIASDIVLWPTREQRIFVFDVKSARQRREAIDLRPLDVKAGNLLVAGSYLIIASAEEIVALGPRPIDGRNNNGEAEVASLK